MKRILVAFILGLAVASLSAQPVMAESAKAATQQQQKKDNKKDSQKKTETVTFKTSIHCQNCVRKINENISFEKGVKDLKVSLDDKQVTISYDPSKTDEATLAKAIEKLGYDVEKAES